MHWIQAGTYLPTHPIQVYVLYSVHVDSLFERNTERILSSFWGAHISATAPGLGLDLMQPCVSYLLSSVYSTYSLHVFSNMCKLTFWCHIRNPTNRTIINCNCWICVILYCLLLLTAWQQQRGLSATNSSTFKEPDCFQWLPGLEHWKKSMNFKNLEELWQKWRGKLISGMKYFQSDAFAVKIVTRQQKCNLDCLVDIWQSCTSALPLNYKWHSTKYTLTLTH